MCVQYTQACQSKLTISNFNTPLSSKKSILSSPFYYSLFKSKTSMQSSNQEQNPKRSDVQALESSAFHPIHHLQSQHYPLQMYYGPIYARCPDVQPLYFPIHQSYRQLYSRHPWVQLEHSPLQQVVNKVRTENIASFLHPVH